MRGEYSPAPEIAWFDMVRHGIDVSLVDRVEGEPCWFFLSDEDGTRTHAFGAMQDDGGEWSWAWGTVDDAGHLDEWDGAPLDPVGGGDGLGRMFAAVAGWQGRVFLAS